jgi:hypothetical protein
VGWISEKERKKLKGKFPCEISVSQSRVDEDSNILGYYNLSISK